MITYYQIITLGSENEYTDKIFEYLYKHIDELGVDRLNIKIIDRNNFYTDYKLNAPTFCLYFGDTTGNFQDVVTAKDLVKNATLIMPIVEDLSIFTKVIPVELHEINGFKLSEETDIEPLVSCILEGLGLLRLARRLFISYKRDESKVAAIQLYEQLEKAGFDVFLDTHSVRPTDNFQEELWHRLADTDIVVLLNTPNFLNSNWTTQELARANAMSIGILQLIWPTHSLERDAEICIPIQLNDKDFGNGIYSSPQSYLTDDVIKQIISQAESLRARSLAARQTNITTEFIKIATKLSVKTTVFPQKFIVLEKRDGKEVVIIPTVGVPQAFTYHQSEELVEKIKSVNVVGTYLLYDHINIREKWLNHLSWLNQYLKVKAIRIIDSETQIIEIVNG